MHVATCTLKSVNVCDDALNASLLQAARVLLQARSEELRGMVRELATRDVTPAPPALQTLHTQLIKVTYHYHII